MNLDKIQNIELDGIDTRDYPDFCDAFIYYAEHKDGTPLSDSEIERINDNSDFVYNLVLNKIF
jgi:hypothetical protein